jgi:hypothetical protein
MRVPLDRLARPLHRPLERAQRLAFPVFVELGELETNGGIVDGRGQRFEIGQCTHAIAADLGDFGSRPKRLGRKSPLYSAVGHVDGPIERPRSPQRSGDAGEIFGGEASLQRFSVNSQEGGHRHDVPRIVLDDA